MSDKITSLMRIDGRYSNGMAKIAIQFENDDKYYPISDDDDGDIATYIVYLIIHGESAFQHVNSRLR